MVRTRSLQKSGHTTLSQQELVSLRPSGRGRRRQIRSREQTSNQEDSSPSILTSSAALSPLPGSSSSSSSSQNYRYIPHTQDDAHLSPGRRGSNSDLVVPDQQPAVEPNQTWEQEAGGGTGGTGVYLLPGPGQMNHVLTSQQVTPSSFPGAEQYTPPPLHPTLTSVSASNSCLLPVEAEHLQPGNGNLCQSSSGNGGLQAAIGDNVSSASGGPQSSCAGGNLSQTSSGNIVSMQGGGEGLYGGVGSSLVFASSNNQSSGGQTSMGAHSNDQNGGVHHLNTLSHGAQLQVPHFQLSSQGAGLLVHQLTQGGQVVHQLSQTCQVVHQVTQGGPLAHLKQNGLGLQGTPLGHSSASSQRAGTQHVQGTAGHTQGPACHAQGTNGHAQSPAGHSQGTSGHAQSSQSHFGLNSGQQMIASSQDIHNSAPQDLVEPQRHESTEADPVIFTTRESGVQADVEHLASQTDRDASSGFLPDDMKHSLECPVCARIALPPVMQCRNGHVTCNACRVKVQSCPMCREIDIDIRNLFAEKAITFMKIPCDYRSFGCRVEVHFKDKEIHERQCRYRPYICPYIECDHKLAADAVVLHVSTAHREECRRSDGPEITASMILIGMYFGGDGAWSPRVITCFGRTFFDVALTRDRWLHHWVWLLGEEEESNNFLYEITAFKGNTKYVYGSEVSSLRTSDDEIVSEGKCLSISDAIGRRLRDGDKIRYKLKLMRK